MNNVSCISQPKMIFNKSLYNVDQPIDFWNRSINLFKDISEQVLTLFRMGGGPTSFSPVTSTNIRFGPQTSWLLVLTLLPHYCKISSLYLVPVPNYWTWTKNTLQKSDFFGQILIKLRLWQLFSQKCYSYQTLVTWPHL